MYDYQTADPCLYAKLKDFSRHNRQNPTEAESVLWECLKARQCGKIFKRQHIIGDFIVDFFCPSEHLVIELDGGYHQLPEQQVSDDVRTEWLESKGYTVIRFTNEEVLFDLENVLTAIENIIT